MQYTRYTAMLLGSALIAFGCSDEDDTNNANKTGGGGAFGGTASGGSNSGGSSSGGDAGNSGNGGVGGAASGGTGGSSAGASGNAGAGGNSSGGSSAGGSSAGGSSGAAGNASGGAGTGGSAATGGSAGSAGSGGCPTGFDECDNDPNTVCETDLSLVTSCGDCNTSCNGSRGSVECQSGTCVITSCDNGWDNCDGDATNGCEQDLTAAKHCGVCGRDCQAAGTTCSAGKCQEVLLYNDLPIVGAYPSVTWALTDTAIFHTGTFNYTIRSFPIAGGVFTDATAHWSAASATAGRNALLADDTQVIWSQRGTPSVVLRKALTAPAAENPQVLFTPQYQPFFLQTRGNAYFWFSGDYQAGDPGAFIYTRAISAAASDPGTRIMSVDQGAHSYVEDFTTSSDALYWYTTLPNPAEVRTTPLSGGTPTVVPTGVIATLGGVANIHLHTLGNTLYYNQDNGTSFANGIYRWTPGDASPTQLVTFENILDFQVDSENIYYCDSSKTYRVPLSGGAGVEIANVGGTTFIGQDATSLYLRRTNSSNTDIFRIIK